MNVDFIISKDDIDLIIHSVTNCPSKQNISFYKVHAITNRQVIENIHDNTSGFLNYETGLLFGFFPVQNVPLPRKFD